MVDNINAFLTCPRCHRMHDERVTTCAACGFEHPVVEQPAEPVEVIEVDGGTAPIVVDQDAE